MNASRRAFLISASATAAGGLLLRFGLGPAEAAALPGAAHLGDYVEIAPDGRITLRAVNADIGQGAKTLLPMIIAEELDAAWAQVHVEYAPADDARYGAQQVGGSLTVPTNYEPMRRVGAVARAMLVQAAASEWKVPADQLHTAASVVHGPGGKKASYGQLAGKAASLPVPDAKQVKLKDPKDFTILGKSHKSVDLHAILHGEKLFGIDMKLPGMQYAVYVKSPVNGAKLKSADVAAAKAMPGVSQVLVLDGVAPPADAQVGLAPGFAPGIAIVGRNWWLVKEAREALKPVWDDGFGAAHGSADYAAKAAELLAKPAPVIDHKGDADQALAKAAQVVEARYTTPFLPHLALEPQNATARPTEDGGVEVWAPTQFPNDGRDAIAKTLKLPKEKVIVHLCRAGGGFGRRIMVDQMVEAAAIAMAAKQPIKLLYPREEDVAHDYYRPGNFHYLKAGLDASGRVSAYVARAVSFSRGGKLTEGSEINLEQQPAVMADHWRLEQALIPTILATGWLRAPSDNTLSFVHQSFWDELAHAAGRDPVEFRLAHMRAHAADPLLPTTQDGEPQLDIRRMIPVLEKVAARAGWGKHKLPAGTAMGVGCYFSHRGYFAEIAQVRMVGTSDFRVEKVWAVGDVGSIILNPTTARAQVEGAIHEGIGQLRNAVHFARGSAVELNFADYTLLRMPDSPEIDIEFHLTDNPVTGLGEPALPAVIPAVTNAIFVASGKRVRELPVRL